MKRYGIIGFPVAHSFSPKYFEDKFKRECIDASYISFELENIADFPEFDGRNKLLNGLNVTAPHKVTVIPFLDSLSPEAEKIGAVNTIVYDKGKKIGHNTDVDGFEFLLNTFTLPENAKALILGNGGAAKAVTYVLDSKQIPYTIAENTPKDVNVLSLSTLKDIDFQNHNIIINCTPVGTFPDVDAILPLPFQALSANHVVIDLVYNPEETKLLLNAKNAGAQCANGLLMLQQQAEAAYALWQK